jgi:hypothetical protein
MREAPRFSHCDRWGGSTSISRPGQTQAPRRCVSLTSTFAVNQARAWGVTLQDSNIAVDRQASSCGVASSNAFTQVTITYNFSGVTNLLPQLQNKQLQAVACYPNA